MTAAQNAAGPRELTAKGRATRARIVDVAAELMHRRGVLDTSTEAVRDASAVSNSQLYHYFPDKRELTHAVIARQAELVLAAQAALLKDVDTLAGLQRWRDAVVAAASQSNGRYGCPIGALTSELADRDETARQALAACFTRWEAAIGNGLTAMREAGELRPDADPTCLAVATLASLQGGLLLAQAHRDNAHLTTALDAAIAHIHSFGARR